MKLRQKLRPSGKVTWEADLGAVNGKRIQRYFDTRTEAEEWLRDTKLALRMEGQNAHLLTKAERTLFAEWRDRLAEAGSTIEDACTVFLANREKLAPIDASIDQAVAFYLSHHRPIKKAPDLVELAQLYIDELKRLRRSPRYLLLARGNLSRFVEFLLPKGVADISRDDVETWVTAGNLAPGTQGNRLVTARAFLEWARSEKYISLSPLDGKDNRIRLPEAQTGEVLSYSLKDAQAILEVALFGSYNAFDRKNKIFEAIPYHPLLGYLSAALFCGVRPEEIHRTDISRLNTAHRSLVITSAASKTNFSVGGVARAASPRRAPLARGRKPTERSRLRLRRKAAYFSLDAAFTRIHPNHRGGCDFIAMDDSDETEHPAETPPSPAPVVRSKSVVRYSPKLMARICERLSLGESLRSVCSAPDMPDERAVRLWVRADRDGCAELFLRARELQAHRLADELLELVDEAPPALPDGRVDQGWVTWQKNRIDLRKWHLAKVLPKEYGDQVALKSEGGGLSIHIDLGPPPIGAS